MATVSVPDPTKDSSSHYYLHPSDHASAKLVSIPFDGTGYADWKRSMIIGLTAKNKMCLVDGSLEKLTTDTPEGKAWERYNNMIIGWLIASLDRPIARSVMYDVTAKEICRDLEERYGQTLIAQVYSLHTELFNIVQEPNMSISDYYTKIKSICDQLDVLDPIPTCSCNGCVCSLTKKVLKSHQSQHVIHFLMKLNEPFNQVRTNILMMEDLPSASLVYRLLLQEERHHSMSKLSSQPPDSIAFHVDRPPDRGPSRHFSDFKGNRNVHDVSTKRTSTVYYCDHCHMHGHTVDRCYKLHGYPPKNRSSYNKRVVALVIDTGPTASDGIEHTGLTKDQFTHLCALLSKNDQASDAPPADPLDAVISANAAGPFDETAFTSW